MTIMKSYNFLIILGRWQMIQNEYSRMMNHLFFLLMKIVLVDAAGKRGEKTHSTGQW